MAAILSRPQSDKHAFIIVSRGRKSLASNERRPDHNAKGGVCSGTVKWRNISATFPAQFNYSTAVSNKCQEPLGSMQA